MSDAAGLILGGDMGSAHARGAAESMSGTARARPRRSVGRGLGEPAHVALDLRLAGYQPAGIARYATELLAALARTADPAAWRFTALIARRDDPARYPPNVEVRRCLTPPHHRLEGWTLPVELAPLGVDLLHSPDFVPPFRRRCRAVVTVHDLAFLRDPALMTAESRRYYGQVRRAVRSAGFTIVPSRATARDAVALLGAARARLRVIPEAASGAFRPHTEAERTAARRRWAAGRRYVLALGTIEPRKNLKSLLHAWAMLGEDAEAAQPRLLVAGGRGWLADDLPALAERLGLGDSVRWLGRVPDADLPALVAGAECLVYPSLYEGFGLPVLEAMASGTPVVTSNVSSLPEIAGDAALLVDPRPADELAAACRRLLGDPALRADLAERGLRRAAGFTWERTAALTLAVYAEALGRPLESAPVDAPGSPRSGGTGGQAVPAGEPRPVSSGGDAGRSAPAPERCGLAEPAGTGAEAAPDAAVAGSPRDPGSREPAAPGDVHRLRQGEARPVSGGANG